jgi:hypothetical protein
MVRESSPRGQLYKDLRVFTAKLNVSNALRAKAAPMAVARRGMSKESAALGPGMPAEIEPERVG